MRMSEREFQALLKHNGGVDVPKQVRKSPPTASISKPKTPPKKRLTKKQLSVMTTEQAAISLAVQSGAREFATEDHPEYNQVIKFIIPIRGRVKSRPRLGVNSTFTPKQTRKFEKAVSGYASIAMIGKRMFTVPVQLDTIFFFDGNPALAPVNHFIGDISNLEKAVEDGMNKIVYKDDNLILEHPESRKFFYSGIDAVFVQVKIATPKDPPKWCIELLEGLNR